jgi:predicted extracellular nuclease
MPYQSFWYRKFAATFLAVVLVLSGFGPAAGAVQFTSAAAEGAPVLDRTPAADNESSVGEAGKRANRTVESAEIIDSVSFLAEFDKTYPKGRDINDYLDLLIVTGDGTEIVPEITSYEVQHGSRENVIITHTNDDLTGTYGTLYVNDISVGFDFASISIAELREQELGTVHTVTGVVTAHFEAGGQTNMYIQDDSAGILVRGTGLGSMFSIGDKVRFTGELDHFRDMKQLLVNDGVSELVERNAEQVTPELVTSADLRDEDTAENLEARLVMVQDARVENNIGFNDFQATDSAGEFLVLGEAATVREHTDYDYIIGVVNYHFYEHKVMPRFEYDLIEDAAVVQPVIASPGSGEVEQGTEVFLSTFTEGAEIYYTADGTEPTSESTLYEGPIEITEETTIKAIAVKDGLTDSPVREFSYTVLPEAGSLEIYDIQGASHISPYENMVVREVPGIVTYTQNNGFYMQSAESDVNVNTSEGIFVYNPGHGVAAGDSVLVDGRVVEFEERGYDDNNDLTTTQIVGSSLEVESSGNELPDPVVVGVDRDIPSVLLEDPDNYDIFDPDTFDAEANALDFYESLEGMLIEIPGQVTVTGPQQYNELTVISEEFDLSNRTPDGGIYLEDDEPNMEIMFVNVPGGTVAKTGDYFEESILGVVGYNFGNFKIQPVQGLPELHDGGTVRRDETTIEFDEDKLTVATYNVENFYPGVGSEKIFRLANSMATELNAPDIVTLVEVMDNDGTADSGNTDASESYQVLIDEIQRLGGPQYAYTDVAPVDGADGGIPGGNIRVGHIYRTDRVHLPAGEIGGPEDALEIDEDGNLNYISGRIDPSNDAWESARKSLVTEFIFKGESVYVIGNHWNSKRGDTAVFGMDQPPVQVSRDQREEIAEVIHDFIAELKDKQPEANVVVLGDFNDFPWSPPLQILEGEGMLYNAIYELPRNEQFTYVYNGNSQSLDSIVVSSHLQEGLKADIMHINSQFMETHGRASDHDPMMVQLEIPNINPDYDMGDTTPPVIEFVDPELNEDPRIVLTVGDSFEVPAVTAMDNVDGDLTDQVTVENNVDTSRAGTYTVRYIVEDAAGNRAVKTLTVVVESDAAPLEELENGSFESWVDGYPENWGGSSTNIARSRVSQSADSYDGDYSVRLENTSTSHNRFTTQPYSMVEGVTYEVTFMARGNGEIRNAMFAPGYHGNNYSNYSPYTVLDGGNWQEITWEYTAPGNGEAQIIFSVRSTSGDHVLVDNVQVQVK